MSTATATPETSVRRALPMEVSNVLAAYWLGVSLVALTVVAAFFVLVDARQVPFANEGGATTFGWLLLVLALGAIIGLASVVASAFAEGRPAGYQWIRIAVIAGIIVMLASLAAAVALPMLGGGAGSLLGPAPVLGGFLLILLAFLPFVFLILALSQSRSDAVRAYFWPETGAEAGAAVEEAPAEEQETAEVGGEEEPEAPYEPAATRAGVGETIDYRTEDADEFAETQEMSPKAQGLIFVDQDLASAPGGSGLFGPESSGTRALEATPEGSGQAELAPEGSDFNQEENVVEQAEAEPPLESIHDESFTPSEQIVLPPDSGVRRAGLQPASEADERLIRSDPVIMVPEEGPPRTVPMVSEGADVPETVGSEPIVQVPSRGQMAGSPPSDLVIEEMASEPILAEGEEGARKRKKDTKIAFDAPQVASEPVVEVPSRADTSGSPPSDMIIEEMASEPILEADDSGKKEASAKKKKKDTKIAPEGAQGEVPPSSGTERVPGVKRPK